MSTPNLDQARAKKALEDVQLLPETERESYLKIVAPVAGMIAINGLVPTLIYLTKPENRKLLEHIDGWLRDPQAPIPWLAASAQGSPPPALAEGLTSPDASPDLLRLATEECLLFVNWLKRWAQAYKSEHPSMAAPTQEAPRAQ